MAENKLIYTIASSKNFSANFNVKATAPLDTRTVVQNKADLYDVMGTFNGFVYEGMLVTVLAEKAVYQLVAIDEVNTKSNIVAAFDTENFDNNSKLWQQVSGGSTVVSSYDDLNEFANKDNIGKTVYLNTEVNDGSETTYTPGLYVVTGAGTINKLEASTVGGQDLASLSAEISNIKTSYVEADTAIVNSLSSYVSDLEASDEGIVTSLSTYVDELKAADTAIVTSLSTYVDELKAADTAIVTSLSTYVSELEAADEEIQDTLSYHIGTVATDTTYGHVKIKNLTDKDLNDNNSLVAYNDFAVDVATLVYSYKSAVNYTETYIDSTIEKLNSSYKGIGTYVDVTVDQESGKITNVTIDDTKIVNALQPIEQDLDNHINGKITYNEVESSLHLEAGEREKWNTAANRINTFMDEEGIDETIDTLHEINDWITEHGSEATDLAKSIAENTSYINELKAADTAIVNSLSSYVSDLEATDEGIVTSLSTYVDELKAADEGILTSLSTYVDELKAADEGIVTSLSTYVSDLQAADDEIYGLLNTHIGTVATDTEYGHVKVKNLNGVKLYNKATAQELSTYSSYVIDVDTLLYAYKGLAGCFEELQQHVIEYRQDLSEHISYVNAEVTSDPTTYGFVTVSIKQEEGKIVSADIDDSNIQSKLDEYKLDIINSYTEADTAIVNSLTSYVSELEAADEGIQNALNTHINDTVATDIKYGHVKLADNEDINNALSGTSYTNIFDAIGNIVHSNISGLTNNVITVGVLSNELTAIKNTINNKIESLDTSYSFIDNNSLISYSYTQENGIITNLSISTYNVAKNTDLTYLSDQVKDVEGKLNTFLGEDDGVLDTINTLQDIQEWMDTEGNAATQLTTHVAEHCDLITSYVMTPKNNWVTI